MYRLGMDPPSLISLLLDWVRRKGMDEVDAKLCLSDPNGFCEGTTVLSIFSRFSVSTLDESKLELSEDDRDADEVEEALESEDDEDVSLK